MSIVVMARGAGLGAWVDEDFAHCRQVVVVAEGGGFRAWENPFRTEDRGADLAQRILAEVREITGVVTANIDPDSLRPFSDREVPVYLAGKGAVLELVEAVEQGALPRA
jgi:predicted Fe-Mo cluster-binding NifX family protein